MTSEEVTKPDFKALAEKLDEDIENYISGLKRSPYKDGWPEDKWEEEMEKHPFFMTKAPSENEELPPFVEALQQLKYDESENTPDELANVHKEDGNFYFKCKKYHNAIASYTAGTKCNCSDDIKAQLYNNLAACHYYLSNFRSAINASEEALKLKKNYEKAEMRIIECYHRLNNYEKCIEACDNVLSRDSSNENILRKKECAKSAMELAARRKRQQIKAEQKKDLEEKRLLQILYNRNVKVTLPSTGIKVIDNISQIQPSYARVPMKVVHLKSGVLIWPVIFVYPENEIFDCIEEFDENTTFQTHLEEMLSEPPDWDETKKYIPNMINIYFKDFNNEYIKVNPNSTLKKTMEHERFVVREGVPLFYLVVKNSSEEKDLMKNG